MVMMLRGCSSPQSPPAHVPVSDAVTKVQILVCMVLKKAYYHLHFFVVTFHKAIIITFYCVDTSFGKPILQLNCVLLEMFDSQDITI